MYYTNKLHVSKILYNLIIGGKMSDYHVKVNLTKNPEALNERISTLLKGAQEGKLVTTKVTVRDNKTVGDRLKFLETLLRKFGIHWMSRTDTKMSSEAIHRFAKDYMSLFNYDQKRNLITAVNTLKDNVLKKETDAEKKNQLSKYFDDIITTLSAPEPIEAPPAPPRPETNQEENRPLPPIPTEIK